MSERYIAEVKITKVEYAGDHDRELTVLSTYVESQNIGAALDGLHQAAWRMLGPQGLPASPTAERLGYT